jgi:carboxyl-terminal processing protease
LTVDGKTPTASDALQGDIDTEVALKIRPKDGAEHDVTLKRSRYSVVYSNTISWPTSEAALIKIWSFARGYDRSAIEELMRQAQKAKYLILDLRGNAGGATNNLQHLLSLLMPEDTIIGTFVNRPLYDQYHEAHPDYVETDPVVIAKDSKLHYLTRHLSVDPFKGKIAVLVNRGTASASEIVAWALRENLHVPILGTQSAGAVLASIYHRLPYGYEVQYPISDYVTKNGIRLENHPIIPDVETSESAVDGKDSAVDKAIERLKTLTIDR